MGHYYNDDYGNESEWGIEDSRGRELTADLQNLRVTRRDVAVKVELERLAREKLLDRMAQGKGLDELDTLAKRFANSPKKLKKSGSRSPSPSRPHATGSPAGFAAPITSPTAKTTTAVRSPVRGVLRPHSAGALSGHLATLDGPFPWTTPDKNEQGGEGRKRGGKGLSKSPARTPGRASLAASVNVRPKSAHSKTRPLRTKAQRDEEKNLRRSHGEIASVKHIRYCP